MGSVARRHKAQLLRMRVAQRGAQRELEATAGADLASRTTFCLVCRLNHRTTRHAHNLTDTHRAMKRFLMPFCRICRMTFRSPMIYEHHISSLDHLKVMYHFNTRERTISVHWLDIYLVCVNILTFNNNMSCTVQYMSNMKKR